MHISRSLCSTLFLAAISVSSPILQAEPAVPLELKGLFPNMPEAEVMASEASLRCQPVPVEQQVLAGGAEKTCKVRTSLAKIPATLKVAFKQGLAIAVIFTDIDPTNYETIKSLLEERFGPPTHAGEFERGALFRWHHEGRRLMLMERDSKLSTTIALAHDDAAPAAGRIREARKSDL